MALRNFFFLAASTTAGGLLALGSVQPAQANLVQNGGFELNSISGTFNSSFLNGTQGVTLNDWTVSTSYSFIADIGTVYSDLNQSGNGPDPVSGTPIAGFNGNPLGLYGSGSGAFSPSSGYFVATDGAYGSDAIITQTVAGFDTSKQYVLSFKYAGGQQQGFTGDATAWWQVSLGGNPYNPPVMTIPSQTYSPWATYTSDPFTPASTSLLLQFEADGAPSGQPPFALLDDVQIVEFGPPPPAGVPGPLPVLGAGMALAWSRKLRRRIAVSSARPETTPDA